MRTTVSTKGQIILPAEIRREDDIRSGQEFEIERLDRGEYLLKRTTKPRNRGLVKLLLSCPVKDWFQPLDRTETTDDTKVPKPGYESRNPLAQTATGTQSSSRIH